MVQQSPSPNNSERLYEGPVGTPRPLSMEARLTRERTSVVYRPVSSWGAIDWSIGGPLGPIGLAGQGAVPYSYRHNSLTLKIFQANVTQGDTKTDAVLQLARDIGVAIVLLQELQFSQEENHIKTYPTYYTYRPQTNERPKVLTYISGTYRGIQQKGHQGQTTYEYTSLTKASRLLTSTDLLPKVAKVAYTLTYSLLTSKERRQQQETLTLLAYSSSPKEYPREAT